MSLYGRKWTPQRDAVLRQMNDDGASLLAILEAVSKLDGPPLTRVSQIVSRKTLLGIKMPAEARAELSRKTGLIVAVSMGKKEWLTEERRRVLEVRFPRGDDIDDIFREVTSLPGGTIETASNLRVAAYRMGLKRPYKAVDHHKRRDAVWTPERDAKLHELVLSGIPREEWVSVLSAIPGPPIATPNQIQGRMRRLGIRLPPELLRAAFARISKIRKGNFGQPLRFTPERQEYARQALGAGTPMEEILAGVNALPGLPIRGVQALEYRMRRYRITKPKADRLAPEKMPRALLTPEEKAIRKRATEARRREKKRQERLAAKGPTLAVSRASIRPCHDPAPEPIVIVQHYTLADAAVNRKQEAARAALAKRNADPFDIARRIGMPPREVLRIQGEMRRGL